MSAANVDTLQAVIQCDVLQQEQNITLKSSPQLRIYCIVLCTVSSMLCPYVIFMNSEFIIFAVTMVCCVYQIILSIFGIFASKDFEKYRLEVRVCMILAMIGVAVPAYLMFILHCVLWMNSLFFVHLPAVMVAVFQGILDIIISMLIGQEICQWCRTCSPVPTSSYSTNSPFYDQTPYNPNTEPLDDTALPPFNPPTVQTTHKPPVQYFHSSPTAHPFRHSNLSYA